MPSAFAPADTRAASVARSRGSRLKRWGAILAVVLVLHGVFAVWFARQREISEPPTEKPPVEIQLLQPQQIAREAVHETVNPAPQTARVARKPSGPAVNEHVLRAVRPDAPAAPAVASTDVAAASGALPGAASGAVAGTDGKTAGANRSGEPSPGIKFSTPPSGNLVYDTFYNGVRNAPGTIRWASDGNGYTMVVSVPLPFVGTFTFSSEGRIDAFGLAPQRYVETRGRRGEDVTTFDRAAGHIAFTRTPSTLPLANGAQDRFSVIMQLASLVRGDPDAYRPGVTRNFYVADNDSGEIWPMETVGDETVRTAAGFVQARHFTRLPRRSGDARRIDVWLAPALGWLPARIAQTEPNGTQIELVWGSALSPSGAQNATSLVRPENSADNGAMPQPQRVEP